MDYQNCLQDLLRCHICDTQAHSLYCDSCECYLCKTCEEKHLSDSFKEHIVVSSDKRRSTPRCLIHFNKICDSFCEQCGIPSCVKCKSSENHRGHWFVDIVKHIQTRKNCLKADLQELKNTIHPKYKVNASYLQNQKADCDLNFEKLNTTIDKNGEYLHKEIDSIIKYQKSELLKMNSDLLSIINTHEKEILRISSEIEKCTADLKELLDSNDVSRVSAYKSRNTEFRKMPHKLIVILPSLTPQKFNKKQLYEQFGFLTAFETKTEEHGYTMESPGAESSPPDRPLIYEPQIITQIKTEYEYNLRSVSCLSDEEIWTCANDKTLRLYNLRGKLVKSIQTKSENKVWDIAVTKSGDLIYTNKSGRTVNIVNDTKIQTVIRLQGWKPGSVCNTSSGDLLVVMDSDDGKQTKVVRYSGSSYKKIQSIQYNDKRQPLYSSDGYYYNKFISENRNLDICVSDYQANAVVVVNQAGKLRFTYTGNPLITKGTFKPNSITTDSQSRILTADCYSDYNHFIHILDQDGQFLRYIDNCDLQLPWGLCVDTSDYLFVAEWRTCKVKKIRYCM